MIYRTILADPPWPLSLAGQRKRAKERAKPSLLPYETMSVDAICRMDVGALAADDCHLWLWTTNQHLEEGFKVMRAWGFKYLAPVHWLKPSGQGNWFIHRTQTLLFGYRKHCIFPMARYVANIFTTGDPVRHSQKPEESFAMIESISPESRLELFARQRRAGWHSWGDEVQSDITIEGEGHTKVGNCYACQKYKCPCIANCARCHL